MGNLLLNAEKGFLVLNFSKKQKVNLKLYSVCEGANFGSMLPMEYSKERNAVRYDLQGKISLAVRMSKGVIDRVELWTILNGIYESMLELFSRGINPNNIDWSPDLVFVDEYGRISFLVYPTTPKTVEGAGIYALIMYVLKNAKPFGKSDKEVLEGYKRGHKEVASGVKPKEWFIHQVKYEVAQRVAELGHDVVLERLVSIIHGVQLETEEEVEESYETVNGFTFMEDDIYTDVQEGTTYIVESDMVLSDDEDDGTQVLITKARKITGYLGIKETSETFKMEMDGSIDEWVFGRLLKKGNGDVDYMVPGTTVSRKHFKVYIEDDDFYIEDLGSSNGTTVNGVRLSKGKPMELFDKSKVKAGDVEMVFRLVEKEVD